MISFAKYLKGQMLASWEPLSIWRDARTGRSKMAAWIPFIILFAAVEILFTLVFAYSQMYDVGVLSNSPELVMVAAYLNASVMMMSLGLMMTMQRLYFARDVGFLASLPIPQWHVLGAKLFMIILNNFFMGLLIYAPAAIIFGIGERMGIEYWIQAIVLGKTVWLLPTAVSLLLSWPLMAIAAKTGKRELVSGILSAIALIVLIILLSVLPTMAVPGGMLASNPDLVQTIAGWFPPAIWSGLALAGGAAGWGWTALLVVAPAVMLAVLIALAGRNYYTTVIAQTEHRRSRRTVAVNFGHWNTPTMALYVREWREMRTPVYALNSFAGWFIGPLLLLMSFLQPGQQDAFAMLAALMGDNSILLAFAAMALVGVLSPAVSTAVSREGRGLAFSRSLPVAASVHITAKLMMGFTISAIASVMAGLFVWPVVKLGAVEMILALGLALCLDMVICALSLLVDVMHPKLSWNSPTEAIKQNMNTLVSMAIGMGVLTLVGGLAWWLMGVTSMGLMWGGLAVVCAVLTAGSIWMLYRWGTKAWERLES